MEKRIVKLSSYEMRDNLPRIEDCISQFNNIDISKIKNGNESVLLFASQKMEFLLANLFGNDSHQYSEYNKYSDIKVINLNNYAINQVKEWVSEKIERAIVTLNLIKEGFLEELEHSNSLSKEEQVLKVYQGLELHPVIASATGKLFNNGHYANAIEDAVKALNNLVRLRTGLLDDGVSLMQKAFSPKKPLLKINELKDECDTNEQKGFMDWFTGTVSGLRNPRAHKIIKDDPEMALEFIAFVSLQAKLVDKASLSENNEQD